MAPPLPRLWLFTDERQGDGLWQALARLPRGAGIVFRHGSLAPARRRALFRQVRAVARRRGLFLLLAGPAATARAWGADGAHGRQARRRGELAISRSVHDLRELGEARMAGADLVFISPVWPTRSHPGAPALGIARLGLLAARSAVPAVALGGMTTRRARALPPLIWGWAAIDAWSAPDDQKRKAVPT